MSEQMHKMAKSRQLWFFMIAALQANFMLTGSIAQSIQGQVCTYYGNDRKPSEAYSLSNCTWFRERSCCSRTEVTSIFQEMMPLDTSSEDCRNRLNYMMCFFCSPTQYKWFKNGKLHICKAFCDDIYTDCEDATYDGKKISSAYSSGSEFCEAQFFNVVEKGKEADCFEFDDTIFGTASSCRKGLLFVVPFIICLINNYFWWT